MTFDRRHLRLYAITNRQEEDRATFLTKVEAALKGGVTLLQLREKNIDGDALIDLAKDVKEVCHRYDVPLIVNDDIDAALAAGADGVHVGNDDAPVAAIRRRVGSNFIIGATAKTVAQAQAAAAAGADYLGIGAVFPSPTKKNAIRVTSEQLREINAATVLPSVAIGGIDHENIEQLRGSGIDGVAVVSAVFGQEDIEAAARRLRNRVDALL